MMKVPARLLNLAEVSREIDVPYARLHRMLRFGEIIPDAVSSQFALFEERNLPGLVASLRKRKISARTVRRSIISGTSNQRFGEMRSGLSLDALVGLGGGARRFSQTKNRQGINS